MRLEGVFGRANAPDRILLSVWKSESTSEVKYKKKSVVSLVDQGWSSISGQLDKKLSFLWVDSCWIPQSYYKSH
jgi:hypothetical protein